MNPAPTRRGRIYPALEGFDAAVRGGALADLSVAGDRLGRLGEHRSKAEHALALGAKLEEPLLHVRPEIDPGGDLVRDRVALWIEVLEVRARGVHDAPVGIEALLHFLGARLIRFVLELVDLRSDERAPFGQLDEAEGVAPLDDDVEPTVGEALEHLDDACAGSDLPHAVLVGEDEAEFDVLVEALADELLVAGLEDVQGRLLAWEEDGVEGEQPELVHGGDPDWGWVVGIIVKD
jgi:hypothetical protein